jgi:transcriptional regulator with XRE-family HTH domain
MSWQTTTVGPSLLDQMAEQEERVAARLRQLRDEYGNGDRPLSQEDAAHKAGVKTRQWQRWEAAAHMPRRSNLEQIAEAFGVSTSAFYEMSAVPAERRSTTQLDRIEASLARIEKALATEPVERQQIAAQMELELDEQVQRAHKRGGADAKASRGPRRKAQAS